MVSRMVFSEELAKLNAEVSKMAELAEEAVKKGVITFVSGNLEMKKEVEKLDAQIFAYDQMIEKHCIDLIALHSPVAGDLRTVSTCLKIITDINRIGRYGRDIAELEEAVQKQKQFKKMASIPIMGDLVIQMVTDAIDSFVRRNAEQARGLFHRDDEIDGLWDSIFRESLTYMMEDPTNISTGTHYILVARYLERIADHACNIGEKVVFMVTGTRMNPEERKRQHIGDHLVEEVGPRYEEGYYHTDLSEK